MQASTPVHLNVSPARAALATDFYQLTMMYAYFAADMEAEATFELFVRRLPRSRRFMIAAGLEQALAYLRDLTFTGEDIDFLRSTPTFEAVADPATRDRFFEQLRAFRFGATVRAIPEGTIFFPSEPIVQVHGGLLEGQLVETYLLSVINYQTLVATKAARMRSVAGDRTLIDMGTRRAHGPQAGMLAARAAFVGGFDATSNVLAAAETGIPVVGTAAHAYTMAFDDEEVAFAHYLDTYPNSTTLLIDTYDTIRGAKRAAALGAGVGGVRLDSGDLGALAKEVRGVLDGAGLPNTRIVASSDLNEYKIAEIVASNSPIDVFGVGTELVTSRDDPTLAGVYKLVQKRVGDTLIPTMKFSSSKRSYPGRKSLYRRYDKHGKISGGALAQIDEPPPAPRDGGRVEPLMQTVFENGAVVGTTPSLRDIRARTIAQLALLPERLLGIEGEAPKEPVSFEVSAQTEVLIAACEARFEL